MNNTNFTPDAYLASLCLADLGDPEFGAESAGILRLMGVDAPISDDADAREAHHSASILMYEAGIELANLQKEDRAWEDDYNDYRGCLVLSVVLRIVTVIVTAVGRDDLCEEEIEDFLSMFSRDDRAELLRSLGEHLTFADPERLGY